jgi:hypothetical protein
VIERTWSLVSRMPWGSRNLPNTRVPSLWRVTYVAGGAIAEEDLTSHRVRRDRFDATGTLDARVARDLATTGVTARASGIDRDARRDHPVAAWVDGIPTHSSSTATSASSSDASNPTKWGSTGSAEVPASEKVPACQRTSAYRLPPLR